MIIWAKIRKDGRIIGNGKLRKKQNINLLQIQDAVFERMKKRHLRIIKVKADCFL